MEKQARHRSDAHGYVIGETVITESLTPSVRWCYVDNERISSYSHGTECDTVYGAQHDEDNEQTCHDIPAEEDCKEQIGHDIDRFAREAIVQITHKRTGAQG